MWINRFENEQLFRNSAEQTATTTATKQVTTVCEKKNKQTDKPQTDEFDEFIKIGINSTIVLSNLRPI